MTVHSEKASKYKKNKKNNKYQHILYYDDNEGDAPCFYHAVDALSAVSRTADAFSSVRWW